jgi:hypothetical protein
MHTVEPPNNNNNRSLEIRSDSLRRVLHSNYSSLPTNYYSDFRDIFQRDMEPVLKGSLHVTIHGSSIKRIDPRNITDWTLDSLSDITFPKSYCRST